MSIEELQEQINSLNLPEYKKDLTKLNNAKWVFDNIHIKNAEVANFAYLKQSLGKFLYSKNMISKKQMLSCEK